MLKCPHEYFCFSKQFNFWSERQGSFEVLAACITTTDTALWQGHPWAKQEEKNKRVITLLQTVSPFSVSSARKRILATRAKLLQSCNICLPWGKARKEKNKEKKNGFPTMFSSLQGPLFLVVWPELRWVLLGFLQPDRRGKSHEQGKNTRKHLCMDRLSFDSLPNLTACIFHSPHVTFCIFSNFQL